MAQTCISAAAKLHKKNYNAKWNKETQYSNKRSRKRRATAETWAKEAIRSLRSRAKKTNREFTITWQDLVLPEKCPVLGITIILGLGGAAMKAPNSPSVDRFDNMKGYTKDNIRIISNRANLLKRDGTLEEMRAIVKYMENVS